MHKALHVGISLLVVATSLVGATRAKTPAVKEPAVDESAQSSVQDTRIGLENVDVRRDPETRELNGANVLSVASKAAVVDRSAAIDALVAKVPTSNPDSVRIDLAPNGLPRTVVNFEGFLTEARSGSADVIARQFLTENAALFGLSPREVRNLKLTVDDLDAVTGVTYLKYTQMVKGLPVFDSEMGVTITPRGEVAIVNQGQLIPGARVSTTAVLSPEAAIAQAFEHCGVEMTADQIRPSAAKAGESSEFTFYESPLGEGHEAVMFQKTVVNVGGEARLAYRAYVDKNGSEWYDTLVDANTGELLVRFNIVHDVQGQVFTRSPNFSRTTVQFSPLFGVSDPWVGTGTVSTGNNVDAYLDRDANNAADSTTTSGTGTNPGLTSGHADTSKASPVGEFTFPWSSTAAPTDQQAPAVANLFYFNNYMHDWMYSLGFTEAARNFQTNNFGRGGAQNDAVKAEAQDGSGTNNANFATPADGSAGRMQMYLFTAPTPDRDGDFDGDVVLHEYGHGVSNRLIGNGSGLGGTQSGAMGEGWSDYWACSNYNDGVMGEYVVNSAAGIRRAPYTVPANSIHDSYADVGNSGFEVHDDGEVWAAALFDLFTTLGKTKADKIVLDGMKNTVTSPSMVAARTGIITACNTDFPADVCAAWTVFARHGLGNSATGNDGTTHNAATDLPATCGGGGGCTSSTTAISSGGSLTGSLATTDCTTTAGNGSAGGYYDNFTFSGTAGQSVTITLNSTAFDCFLRLNNPSGTQVATDDDSNGGTNSKLVYTLAATGTYTIRTTSYSPGSTGSYTVALTVTGGGGGGGTQLITNGGFEGSASPWVLAGNVSWSTGAYPHGGTGYSIVCGGDSNSGNEYQQITIPSGTSPNLTFYLNVTSSETTTTTQYDKLFVEILNTSGTVLATPATFSNLNKGTAGVYTLRGPYSLGAYAGQTIRVRFRGTTDVSLPTSFRVDDVSAQ